MNTQIIAIANQKGGVSTKGKFSLIVTVQSE